MDILVSQDKFEVLVAHVEAGYPNEAGGFLLGRVQNGQFRVEQIVPLENEWSDGSQENRFALTEQTSLKAHLEAAKQGLDVIGVFHSHPDHPAVPSQWDLAWATWPNFSFLITTVAEGKALVTRAWRLADDRQSYEEDTLTITQEEIV